MFWHSSREKHGLRLWWHFKGGRHRCISVELGWWHHFCHASVSVDDDGWNLSLAIPPLFFHFSLEGFPLWQPQRKCIATWDQKDPTREFWLVDQRECRVAILDWKLWLTPCGKSMEWVSADPWWVRGVTLDVKRLLGKQRYTCETLRDGIPVRIPMPEGIYSGTAKIEKQTWKRSLWFTHTRVSTWIDVPKGIPFQGKGENSWDCGDDGLFGTGYEGTDIQKAITNFRESVEKSRQRYGRPSEESIRKALA